MNALSGEIAFEAPADFETPTGANTNNDYQRDIEARTATTRRFTPLSLEKSQPNKHVGIDKPGAKNTATRARFFDAKY